MFVSLFVFFNFLFITHGYNILCVFPHDGKSHLWIFGPIIKELASKGHTLTVLAHHSFNIQANGYREIILSDNSVSESEIIPINFMNVPLSLHQLTKTPFQLNKGLESCNSMLSNEEVQHLIQSEETFDLIFAEFFNTDCVQGFVHRFKAPVVGISSTTMICWHTEHFGTPNNPSYMPCNHLNHEHKMNFLERLDNFLGLMWVKMQHRLYLGAQKDILDRYFPEEIPDLLQMTRNSSLILVNSHFTFSFPRPLVPGVVEVGGIHVSKAKKLPANIEKFINESTHGVIYFSLGSMIKGHTFPQEKREEFLKAFARLPQRVLWKWENETMPGKPDNVMIQKWMPQFDILSHPNVKAFISHGGLLGTTEAVHCGVPMLVMPQYGDQHTNAKAVEANGGGVILYLKDATEEKVYQSLKTILDPEFKAKAQALSERFRDRPMSPMDTAIYWIEYVARHKGAPHLRTAAVDMPLYQYLLLDVLAFLLAIILTFVYVTYKILSLIFRKMFSKKKMKQS